MTFDEFHSLIKYAIPTDDNSSQMQRFLEDLFKIVSDTKEDNTQLRMTDLTILFEGFYQSLAPDSALKKNLLAIRMQRWQNHFGTPTILFLLTHQASIKFKCQYFKGEVTKELIINPNSRADVADNINNVLVNLSAIAKVEMLQVFEQPMVWLKTYNPAGGYTLPAADEYSQQFIVNAGLAKEKVLEIGAAFGTATLEALKLGAVVHCNDISELNLAVVQKRYAALTDNNIDSVTGDNDKLTLLPGAFPEELSGLPAQSYHAILACRVLHFLPGVKIDIAIKEMANLLKMNGKIYIVCETPFQKNWSNFLPEFEQRVRENAEWPGEITDSSKYETSERRGTALPRFMHNLTEKELIRSAERSELLVVEKCEYISRAGQFTSDAIMDGRESVGLVARRYR
ncbi:MAG: class I SAM-dependent methyltransferase [Pseudomonadota bacterium]